MCRFPQVSYMLLCTLLSTTVFNSYSDEQAPEKPRVCIVGTGYVGLPTAGILSSFGNHVACVDVLSEKIAQINNGRLPIFEPGLEQLLQEPIKSGRLTFSTDVLSHMQRASIIVIAVGTPMSKNGAADLRAIDAVVEDLAKAITSYKIICIKSTVPVGTCAHVRDALIAKGINKDLFDIVSNPEFLREGTAVQDSLNPDRIIIGGNPRATTIIKSLYQPLIDKGSAYLITSLETSELIKYASNAMLATRITFINEMARLCDKVGANVLDVAAGMGMDKRIGTAFLVPGPGFGGSCFPKDTKALAYIMKNKKIGATLINAIYRSNVAHKKAILKQIDKLIGDFTDKKVALLGLAFKANTDDIRDSFAIDAIAYLLAHNAHVSAYDPQGMDNMRTLFPQVSYGPTLEAAVQGADLIVIITEWNEFKTLNVANLAQACRTKRLLDLRNIIDRATAEQNGFTYIGMGVCPVKKSAKMIH